MMARLFLPNFDFEHQLPGRRGLPQGLQLLNEELAPVWVAVAKDGDLVYTPGPIDMGFFEALHAAGLPAVRPVVNLDAVRERAEVCPWGWTDEIRAWAQRRGHVADAPRQEIVRVANSRRFSTELEREGNVALPGAAVIGSEEELAGTLERLPGAAKWAVKAEFSMSARERILGRGRLISPQAAGWVRKRLQADGAVYFEPWVERIEEAGLQFTVPPLGTGPPVLEGITPLITDQTGHYRGSGLTPDPDLEERWSAAVETAVRAAERLQQMGYFGPLGIDAMRCRTEEGEIRLRPLQDINARWTMGRLSLGFRKLLRPGERGEWWHIATGIHGSSRGWLDRLYERLPTGARPVLTTPLKVGDRPTRRGTAVVITGA